MALISQRNYASNPFSVYSFFFPRDECRNECIASANVFVRNLTKMRQKPIILPQNTYQAFTKTQFVSSLMAQDAITTSNKTAHIFIFHCPQWVHDSVVELLTCSAQLAECSFKYECHTFSMHHISILSVLYCGSKCGLKDVKHVSSLSRQGEDVTLILFVTHALVPLK